MEVYLGSSTSTVILHLPSSPLTDTSPLNMTVVSNDSIWWPVIIDARVHSYFSVVSFTVVLYDLAITFGQEFELVWRRPLSRVNILYLIVRYTGIPFIVVQLLVLPSVSLTNTGCLIFYLIWNWIAVVMNSMLGVIVIIRLHAMYHQPRKLLVFLSGIYLAVVIACVVLGAIQSTGVSGVEYVLSGTYLCSYNFPSKVVLLMQITWILSITWGILALCLAIWIAVKHFRELPRESTGRAVQDCFTTLIETHVFYFASFVAVACLQLGSMSRELLNSTSVESPIFFGLLLIAQGVQMFVLGPRLILSVREYHAQLVTNSDEATGMSSFLAQYPIHISTGGGVYDPESSSAR